MKNFSARVKDELGAAGSAAPFPQAAADGAEIREYIRLAFLSGGSISIPENGRRGKGYHLEFIAGGEKAADMLLHLLAQYDIFAGKVLRKNKFVVYLKESGYISDCLALMGAPLSVLELNKAVSARSMRNRIQRETNCIRHNIDRSVDAAAGQLAAIKRIEKARGLDSLPPPLKKAAEARLKNPEMSIGELADGMRPRISKSGLHHRLEKIAEIADKI